MLAAIDLDLMQSVSMAIGVQRQTEMNPITIVFDGINDHLHSRGFLSRHPEKRFLHQNITESRVCTVSGICTSPGWIEVCVCDGGFALGKEI